MLLLVSIEVFFYFKKHLFLKLKYNQKNGYLYVFLIKIKFFSGYVTIILLKYKQIVFIVRHITQ